MAHIIKTALVTFSAEQMYDLVEDVKAYPDFLPWCHGSEVREIHENEVSASVEFSMGGVTQSFTTRNTLQQPEKIQVCLEEGPFETLEGVWHFQALSDSACKISLDLQFSFANRLLEMAIGPVFHQIASTLVDSFCQRAEVIYNHED
jgi:ribosome-associated toxin RatA of RatAB toxin-antitoxin module